MSNGWSHNDPISLSFPYHRLIHAETASRSSDEDYCNKSKEEIMRRLVRKVSDGTKLRFAMQFVSAALVIMLAVMTAAAYAADAFAPVGTKATLSVDYVYESAGKKRSAILVAELAAQPATAMPTVQAIDAAQMAELQGGKWGLA